VALAAQAVGFDFDPKLIANQVNPEKLTEVGAFSP
jgi:hypothetical protein